MWIRTACNIMNAIYGCRQQAGWNSHNKHRARAKQKAFASHKYILFQFSLKEHKLIAVYVVNACIFGSHPLLSVVRSFGFGSGFLLLCVVCWKCVLRRRDEMRNQGQQKKNGAWSWSVFLWNSNSNAIANLCYAKQTWWFLIFDSTHLFGTCCCCCCCYFVAVAVIICKAAYTRSSA